MKKLLLSTLAAALTLAGCNRADTGADAGLGSLRVSASADPTVIHVRSRASNLATETYHLTLLSGQTVAYEGTLPASGTVAGLPAGTYTGTLCSGAAGFTIPAFDAPFSSATVAGIEITSGGTTPVAFTCKQSNAGVRFVYDASLAAAGLGDVVPVVTQDGKLLTYSDKDATGYFAPGMATLTLLDGGVPIVVSGAATATSLTLAARELWTITLKASVQSGGAGITAGVDTGTDDRELEITIDPPGTATTPDPAQVVFVEDFAGCTGATYPVEGAVFDVAATFPNLLTSSAVANAKLTGWTFTSGYTCLGGLKMGSSSGIGREGVATTPPLNALGDGSATVVLTFLAANFEPSAHILVVDVKGGGSVVQPAGGAITLPAGTPDGGTVTADAAMKRYTVIIDGATSATRIVFSPASTTGDHRYFLADITVSKNE